MRRHWKKLALLLGAALAACILPAVPAADREPTYQGLKLSKWMMGTLLEDETDALLHMGTNIYPFLVKWACNPSPAWHITLARFYNAHPKIAPSALRKWYAMDQDMMYRAQTAFAFLGTNAYPALLELNPIATKQGWTSSAAACTALILYGGRAQSPVSPELLAAEQQALLSPDPIIRQAATNAHAFLLQGRSSYGPSTN